MKEATWTNFFPAVELDIKWGKLKFKVIFLDFFRQFCPKYCSIFPKNLCNLWPKIFEALKILRHLKMNWRWRWSKVFFGWLEKWVGWLCKYSLHVENKSQYFWNKMSLLLQDLDLFYLRIDFTKMNWLDFVWLLRSE